MNLIEGMPVSKDVRDDVGEALSSLNSVCKFRLIFLLISLIIFSFQLYAVASQSPQLALQYSSKALEFASRAFFNPDMLALLYFPPEHKVAVYTPLLAPVGGGARCCRCEGGSGMRKKQRK